MSIHSKTSVALIETKMKEKYRNLINSFSGSPYTPTYPEEPHEKNERVLINASELRMAIDEFSAVLKEAKRFAK